MKEITRIITCEITYVTSDENTVARPSTHEDMKAVADILKKNLCVDNVVVTNVQSFLRDEDGSAT